MSAMLTADWCPLGRDAYYRKFEVYPMGWDLNLDNVCCAAAQYGGPIAVIRDKKKFVRVQGSGKPTILIYSSSGHLISSVLWSSGAIVELGWSSSEELLCVQSDGIVLMYDIFGGYQHAFGMGEEAKENKVVDAQLFNSFSGTGLAVLTSSLHFFLINSVHEPKLRKVAEMPGPGLMPTSWCVFSEERHSRLLAARDRELLILSDSEMHAQPVSVDISGPYSAITDMVASHDHKAVALLTDTGRLWMGTANLHVKFCEVDTGWRSRPQQLVWCGSEAVLGLWGGGSLLLIGRDGERLSYAVDEGTWLVQEMDCVRLLCRNSHELLQKVPTVVQEVFRINSTEPGSFLLEASRQFQKGSHRSDEYLRIVKDRLEEAVKQCTEAAGYEFTPSTQKMLMKASQFGKSFLENAYDCEKFVEMCRTLRVLNSVRDYKVGIPLTFIQLEHLSKKVLLDRLVLRKHYYLAIQIAKYLSLPDVDGASRILALWACYKVGQVHLQEELVAREIADKLGQAPGVSYTDIATRAIDAHRNQLAIKLMDFEPRAGLQVPLLLRLKEGRAALVKAIDSGNTDLVHMVMQHLREHMPLGEFLLFIRSYPLAQALNLKYCRVHNRETLRYIYEQEDDYAAQAACSIREAYEPKNSSSMELMLSSACESYRRGKFDTNASLCEEQAKLLRHQRSLQDKLGGGGFVGLSVHDTLCKLLSMRELKLADKLKQEYKIPDRRYWWVRIKTLAEQGDWLELDKFSKTKKSPIGYEPFVDVCLEHSNEMEAQKYVTRVTDELKVKYYVKLRMFAEAAKVAFEQKDVSALEFVHSSCLSKDPDMANQISALIHQLGPRK